MSLKRKRSLLVTSAFLAATVTVWPGGRTGMSARTRIIGSDRIVSIESLPEANEDLCPIPGADAVNLAAAIVSMESFSIDDGAARENAPL